MRPDRLFSAFSARARGLSLLELGFVMVFISLALVPVVKMIGGPTSADGNAAQITGTKNKEAILANTMVNKVLANDFTSFKCGGGGSPTAFNPNTELPKDNHMVNFGRCQAANGNNSIYYEWDVLNLTASNNGNEFPSQNQYFQATFNVTDASGKSLMSMPVNFFYNFGAFDQPTSRTGVMLSLDISGSMASAKFGKNAWSVAGSPAFSVPYMFYRYKAFPNSSDWGSFPSNPPHPVLLDKWDNSELDLVIGRQLSSSNPKGQDPDTSTPYNDAFPFAPVSPGASGYATWGLSLLGTGNCASNSLSVWNSDKNLQYSFITPIFKQNNGGGADARDTVSNICSVKSNYNDWSSTINSDLSRLEAARTASLSLLINLESKDSVARSIELGFLPWDNAVHWEHLVPMEQAQSVSGYPGLYFKNLREKLLWINRADPADPKSGKPVVIMGSTGLSLGIDAARQQLMAQNYDRRIIVVLTDGQPNVGITSTSGLKSYALNTFGNNAPKNQQITLFTVGLIAADNNLLDAMATSTPDGQNFAANDVAELKPIFDAISYQIQKLALLSTADRYGLSF